MAKSINEIIALNSLHKLQAPAESKKPKRAGAAKRARGAKASKGVGIGPQRSRKASTATSSPSRAAQKRTQRAAARSLFASDVQIPSSDTLRANNLAVTAPLTTLAPGASLRVVPNRTPMMFDPATAPSQARAALPSGKVSIGQLYSALVPSLGSANAYAFCQTLLNQRWESFMAAEKSWQEDEALNAKLGKEASERAQQRSAEQKKQHDASQAQVAAALQAAQASLNAKHAAAQAAITHKQTRPHAKWTPVRTASTTVVSAKGVGSAVVTTDAVDALDNTPIAGIALTPAEPASRPAPASPQERGARQAKRLRQSADAEMI